MGPPFCFTEWWRIVFGKDVFVLVLVWPRPSNKESGFAPCYRGHTECIVSMQSIPAVSELFLNSKTCNRPLNSSPSEMSHANWIWWSPKTGFSGSSRKTLKTHEMFHLQWMGTSDFISMRAWRQTFQTSYYYFPERLTAETTKNGRFGSDDSSFQNKGDFQACTSSIPYGKRQYGIVLGGVTLIGGENLKFKQLAVDSVLRVFHLEKSREDSQKIPKHLWSTWMSQECRING